MNKPIKILNERKVRCFIPVKSCLSFSIPKFYNDTGNFYGYCVCVYAYSFHHTFLVPCGISLKFDYQAIEFPQTLKKNYETLKY